MGLFDKIRLSSACGAVPFEADGASSSVQDVFAANMAVV